MLSIKQRVTTSLIILLTSASLFSANMTWEKVDTPDLEGYTIHYGTKSGDYETSIDVGNATSYDLNSINSGTYFFSMTSRDKWGNVSEYTSELEYSLLQSGAPELLEVYQLGSCEIELSFSQVLDPGTAEDISNYAISPSIMILDASLTDDGKGVILVTGMHVSGEYQVTVNGIHSETALPIAPNTTYTYMVSSTGVSNEMNGPAEFALEQNYPNPFNPSTQIQYSIKEPGRVRLIIFNVRGETVRTLIDQDAISAGTQAPVTWDGLNDFGQIAASGMYFYRLESGSDIQTMRMQLLR